MRHQNKGFKLGRTHAHRKATLASLSTALIKHKRIQTTLTKAKALRMHIEPILTRAKDDSTHSRRQVFRYLQDKEAVKVLFDEVADKISDRPGGYTRIVKLGARPGDGAEMAVIELVDYNDVRPDGAAGGRRKRTRRSRSRGRSQEAAQTPGAQAKAASKPAPAAPAPAAKVAQPEAAEPTAEPPQVAPAEPAAEPTAEPTAETPEAGAAEPKAGDEEPKAGDEEPKAGDEEPKA